MPRHDTPVVPGRYRHGLHRPGPGRDAGREGIARWPGGEPADSPTGTRRPRRSSGSSCAAGVSHVESFDPKPELNRYAGKSIDATPYKDVLNPSKLKDLVSANPRHGGRKILMGLNTGLPEVRPVRAGGRRLVAARRLVRRRHRRRPLALDDRQRPRRPAPVPHRPARPRRGSSDDRLVGLLRAGHAQREPAGVRRAGRADRRLLRRLVDPRGGLPRPGARRRPAQPRRARSRCRSSRRARA